MHAVVLVLGDLGRSPRMQYHALSFANLSLLRTTNNVRSNSSKNDTKPGKRKEFTQKVTVSLVGYEGERTVKAISDDELINEYRLAPWEFSLLRNVPILHAVCKGISLVLSVLWLLLVRIPTRYDLIVIQNPPCLPALIAAVVASVLNRSSIMIDWHNLGFAMFQERHDKKHPLVLLARYLEYCFTSLASYHICVSKAMKHWLKEEFAVQATVLYDRPPSAHFQKTGIDIARRHRLLSSLGFTDQQLFPSTAATVMTTSTIQTYQYSDGDVGDGTALGASYKFRSIHSSGGDGSDSSEVRGAGKRNRMRKGHQAKDATAHSSISSSTISGRVGLLISCTSWTPDEDFNILLDALLQLEEALSRPSPEYHFKASSREEEEEEEDTSFTPRTRQQFKQQQQQHLQQQQLQHDGELTTVTNEGFSRLLVVVTGKGPMKDAFLQKVADYSAEGRLNQRVAVRTAWLAPEDYPDLLQCADLGVCLHTSTSGLDLPMKVLDMFGSGVPVCAFQFPALPELVQEGVNGVSFTSSAELAQHIHRLLIHPTSSTTSTSSSSNSTSNSTSINSISGKSANNRRSSSSSSSSSVCKNYGSHVQAHGVVEEEEGKDADVCLLRELRQLRQGALSISCWEDNWRESMLPLIETFFARTNSKLKVV